MLGRTKGSKPESEKVTYTKPEFDPLHPWPRACKRFTTHSVPDVAKLYAESKIGPDCRVAFLLGFMFAQEIHSSASVGIPSRPEGTGSKGSDFDSIPLDGLRMRTRADYSQESSPQHSRSNESVPFRQAWHEFSTALEGTWRELIADTWIEDLPYILGVWLPKKLKGWLL